MPPSLISNNFVLTTHFAFHRDKSEASRKRLTSRRLGEVTPSFGWVACLQLVAGSLSTSSESSLLFLQALWRRPMPTLSKAFVFHFCGVPERIYACFGLI